MALEEGRIKPEDVDTAIKTLDRLLVEARTVERRARDEAQRCSRVVASLETELELMRDLKKRYQEKGLAPAQGVETHG